MKTKETLSPTDMIYEHKTFPSDRRTAQPTPRLRPRKADAREENESDNERGQRTTDDTMAPKRMADIVGLNVPVVVRDLQTNEEITFTIVECDAADPDQNRISFASPVGFALLWKRVGDTVKVNLPEGQAHYHIVGLAVESANL